MFAQVRAHIVKNHPRIRTGPRQAQEAQRSLVQITYDPPTSHVRPHRGAPRRPLGGPEDRVRRPRPPWSAPSGRRTHTTQVREALPCADLKVYKTRPETLARAVNERQRDSTSRQRLPSSGALYRQRSSTGVIRSTHSRQHRRVVGSSPAAKTSPPTTSDPLRGAREGTSDLGRSPSGGTSARRGPRERLPCRISLVERQSLASCESG